MKVVCIMQTRVGSTRLHAKVLKEICGKTVLEHDINRIKLANNVDDIIIATTTEKQDEKIVDEANRLGVKYFRGSESDVLSRYYFAAKENNADVVLRVTSDCPCLDYRILEDMIDKYLEQYDENNYLSNTVERSYPRGYDIEIFSFKALEEAHENAKKDYEREHVTPYIYNPDNNFKILSYKNIEDYSNYRVTLDTKEDYEVINAIYENLFYKKGYFLLEDVIEFLNNNPEIADINKEIKQKRLGE